MKKMNFKKLASLAMAMLMALLLLAGCGSSSETAKDIAIADLAAAVDEALGKGDSLVAVDENYIKGYMKMDVSDMEHTVKINAYGANIDEYGIFKGDAKKIKSMVEAYLKLREESWMDEYMPEEKPKLTSAEIKTAGDYVIYCILSDADKTAAFEAFEGALK